MRSFRCPPLRSILTGRGGGALSGRPLDNFGQRIACWRQPRRALSSENQPRFARQSQILPPTPAPGRFSPYEAAGKGSSAPQPAFTRRHHLDGLRQVGLALARTFDGDKALLGQPGSDLTQAQAFLTEPAGEPPSVQSQAAIRGLLRATRTALRSPRRRLDLIDGLICRPLIDPEGGGAAVNCRRRVRPQKRWAAAPPARSRASAGMPLRDHG